LRKLLGGNFGECAAMMLMTSAAVAISGFYPYTWWAQLVPSEK